VTPEVQRLERLAERLRAIEPFIAPPGAKIRGWNLVLAAVEQSTAARSRAHPFRRLVVGVLAAAVLLVAGALAASADSLPDSRIYPLKGVLENVRGALTFSPSDKLAYHLDLARTRLTESEAMIARQRLDLASRALSALDSQLYDAALVVKAEKQSDPPAGAAMERRLRQAITTHDAQLASLLGQVTDPSAVTAITKAREDAARALQVATTPATPGSSISPTNPGAAPTGTSPVTVPTTLPHATGTP
jgi:hypothetical protein